MHNKKNTSNNVTTVDNNFNCNTSWDIKVNETKQKLAKNLKQIPSSVVTVACQKKTSSTNDNKATTPSTTSTSSISTHYSKKESAKSKSAAQTNTTNNERQQALGDILVDRLLHDYPDLLTDVVIEDWEALLALPVDIMVELLYIMDGGGTCSHDEVAKEDRSPPYDWNDVWMHVCHYHLNK